MPQYALRFTGSGLAPPEHVNAIAKIPGIKILDQSPQMMLVEGDEPQLRQGIKALPGWSLHPVESYSLPDTRKRAR